MIDSRFNGGKFTAMTRIRSASSASDQVDKSLGCDFTAHRSGAVGQSGKQKGIFRAGLILQLAMFALAFAFLSGTNLHAQTGSINGTVVDASGAVIPGADIQLVDQKTGGVAREVQSDASGNFRALNLTPSTYTVKVTAPGMQQLSRSGLVLDPDQNLGVGQLQMSIGQASQTVVVNTATPTIDTTSSNNAAVIDQRQVTEQPLNGRDFESLLTTTPGVVTNNNSSFRLVFNQTNDFYVNGMRGTDNNFFLDGIINTDIGANDGEYTDLSIDAVGEFKTLTGNYNAEYGRSPGVMILVNTKSGGQRYHGTLYEFNRNTDYDANDWFSNHYGKSRSILRFNQFGANVGGYIPVPVISPRDNKKLFFFFNYEGTRASRPSGGTYYTVPVPQLLGLDSTGAKMDHADLSTMYRPGNMCDYNGTQTCTPIQDTNGNPVRNGQAFVPGTVQYNSYGEVLTGTPYAGNIIPASQFNSQYTAMINDFTPAYKGNFNRSLYQNGYGDLEQVNFQDTYTFYKNQYALRVDYNFGPKANAFFRYVDDRQQEQQGFGIFSGPSFPVVPMFRQKPGKSWAWSLVNIISPTLTNEVSVGWLHLNQLVDIVSGTSKNLYDKTALGFTFSDLYPSTNTHNLAPGLNDGGGYINTNIFPAGWTSTGNTVVLNDDVTKIYKNHVIKFGIMLDLNENGQEGSWQEPVSFNFSASNNNPNNANNSMANMLLGNATTASQTNNFVFGAFHMYQYEGYVQDEWRVTPRLTLDYGLRYQFLGPTYTAGKYHQYYFEPDAYLPAQAVTINTDPNTPGQAPTQGSICQAGSTSPSCQNLATFGNPYNGMVREGTSGLPKGGMDFRYNNFGPRLGFAWDVFGTGKTAIRGGYGLFYERYQQNTFNFGGISNPPVVYTPTLYGTNISTISAADVTGTPLTPSGGVLTVFRKGMIPTTAGYNFGIQQALPYKMAVDVSYIGNTSRHQIYIKELEQLPLGTTTSTNILSTVNNVQNAILPYKGYSSILQTVMGASSTYNGMQIKLTRRFSNSLTFNADYTWAKATDLDDVDGDQNVFPDYTQLNKFYAPAGYDRRNVANFQYVYDLPQFKQYNKFVQLTAGGWEISGITQFWSGTPCLAGNSPTSDSCDLNSSGNLGNGGWGHIRPDYVGGSYSTSHSHNVAAGANPMWYNPAVFAVPANGTFGTFHRNTIYGPGVDNWNFSVFKNFIFNENTRFQLRFEGYNVFNHTQWGNINNSLSSSQAAGTTYSGGNAGSSGQITSVRDPRTLQLGGKFYF